MSLLLRMENGSFCMSSRSLVQAVAGNVAYRRFLTQGEFRCLGIQKVQRSTFNLQRGKTVKRPTSNVQREEKAWVRGRVGENTPSFRKSGQRQDYPESISNFFLAGRAASRRVAEDAEENQTQVWKGCCLESGMWNLELVLSSLDFPDTVRVICNRYIWSSGENGHQSQIPSNP